MSSRFPAKVSLSVNKKQKRQLLDIRDDLRVKDHSNNQQQRLQQVTPAAEAIAETNGRTDYLPSGSSGAQNSIQPQLKSSSIDRSLFDLLSDPNGEDQSTSDLEDDILAPNFDGFGADYVAGVRLRHRTDDTSSSSSSSSDDDDDDDDDKDQRPIASRKTTASSKNRLAAGESGSRSNTPVITIGKSHQKVKKRGPSPLVRSSPALSFSSSSSPVTFGHSKRLLASSSGLTVASAASPSSMSLSPSFSLSSASPLPSNGLNTTVPVVVHLAPETTAASDAATGTASPGLDVPSIPAMEKSQEDPDVVIRDQKAQPPVVKKRRGRPPKVHIPPDPDAHQLQTRVNRRSVETRKRSAIGKSRTSDDTIAGKGPLLLHSDVDASAHLSAISEPTEGQSPVSLPETKSPEPQSSKACEQESPAVPDDSAISHSQDQVAVIVSASDYNDDPFHQKKSKSKKTKKSSSSSGGRESVSNKDKHETHANDNEDNSAGHSGEGKARKKAIISQALASLHNQWKARVLQSRQQQHQQEQQKMPQASNLHSGGSSDHQHTAAILNPRLLGSPFGPESPASAGSRVPGGILREARLQVDEGTIGKMREQTSDESSDGGEDEENEELQDSSSFPCRSSRLSDDRLTAEGSGDRRTGDRETGSAPYPQHRSNSSSTGKKSRSPIKDRGTSHKRGRPVASEKEKTASSRKGNAGTIECEICSAVKHYSHRQRRHGVYACAPCAKFFNHFMKNREAYYCESTGDCSIDQTTDRCRACWLKICLQKFSINDQDRDELTENNFLPKLKSEPHVSLIAVDTSSMNEQSFGLQASNPVHVPAVTVAHTQANGKLDEIPTKRRPGRPRKQPLTLPAANNQQPQQQQSANAGLLMLAPQSNGDSKDLVFVGGVGVAPNSLSRSVRGPRVKTVCRSTATGLPRATFSPKNTNVMFDSNDRSCDDGESEETGSQRSCDSEDSDAIPVTDYIIMNHKREMREERLSKGLPVDDEDGEAVAETSKENKNRKKKPSKGQKSESVPKKRKAKDSPSVLTSKDSKKKVKAKASSSPESKKNKKSSAAVPSLPSPATESETEEEQKPAVISPSPAKKRGPKAGTKRGSSAGSSSAGAVLSTPKKKKKKQETKDKGKSSVKDKTPTPQKKDKKRMPVAVVAVVSTPAKKVIKKRCGTCEGCTRDDCGECPMCRDKKRFGGPAIMKQACGLRKCAALGENSRSKKHVSTIPASQSQAGPSAAADDVSPADGSLDADDSQSPAVTLQSPSPAVRAQTSSHESQSSMDENASSDPDAD